MMIIARIIKDILTVKNGEDFCFAKITGAIGILAAISFTGVSLYHHHAIQIQDFCIGVASIIASACGGAKMKETTEPE